MVLTKLLQISLQITNIKQNSFSQKQCFPNASSRKQMLDHIKKVSKE